MSGVTTTYTNTAVIVEIAVSKRVVPQNPEAYRCPENASAKVSGTMVVDDVGAASKIAIGVKRDGDATYYPIGEMVATGGISSTPSYVVLHQNDFITSVGNNGQVAGTADINLTIQEVYNTNAEQAFLMHEKMKRKKEGKKVVRHK